MWIYGILRAVYSLSVISLTSKAAVGSFVGRVAKASQVWLLVTHNNNNSVGFSGKQFLKTLVASLAGLGNTEPAVVLC